MKTLRAKERGFESPPVTGFSPRPEQQKKKRKVIYPERDGKPMADNTKQFNWIVKIKENLERMFADRPDVFVAGDLLWYPVEGNNKIRMAPDAMVAFGRPKGDRGSYRTWDENHIHPHVVFEILSPGNRKTEMEKKRLFYRKYGVQEYYVYDPDRNLLTGWIRSGKRFRAIEEKKMRTWISPLLKIRFDLREDDLHVSDSEGKEFLTHTEYDRQLRMANQMTDAERMKADAERMKADAERMKAEKERMKAEKERLRAKKERQRADAERREKERLAAKLRELGISPD